MWGHPQVGSLLKRGHLVIIETLHIRGNFMTVVAGHIGMCSCNNKLTPPWNFAKVEIGKSRPEAVCAFLTVK